MSLWQKRRGFHVPALLVPFVVVLGLAIFVAVLPLAAQSPDPSDESVGPLVESDAHSVARALYDADGDGAIDIEEFLAAVRDHLDGRIDKATARLAMELHIGGSLAYGAAGTEKEWARIACIYIGCPIYPTLTPTPLPTATHTPTPTNTAVAPLPPANTPTPPGQLPPTPQPWTPTPTPIPRLSNPCGHYDFNGNGRIDPSEADQAISDEANGILHRAGMIAVIACYLAPKPPKPKPTATHTRTPTPVPPTATDTPPPVNAPPYQTATATPVNTPVLAPTPTNTPPPSQALPGKPTGLSAVSMIGNRGIELTWNASDRATSYTVKVTGPSASVIGPTSLTRAEITELIPDKKYTFRIVAKNSAGEISSDSIAATVPVPKHWWGHQADHTVEYEIGAIDSKSQIIEKAILPAVASWNSKLKELKLTKDLLFCSSCGTRNSDDSTVTIMAATDKNRNRSVEAPEEPEDGCGTSYACAMIADSEVADTSVGIGSHMEDMFIVFENPPWSAEETPSGSNLWSHSLWEWTDKDKLNGREVPFKKPKRHFVYVGRVMLHELGHTLGLHDFYCSDSSKPDIYDCSMDHLTAVMSRSKAISDEDLSQLRAIYILHDSH